MNLDEYIKRLLPENEILIIPGFGALVSEYKPAAVNGETGEITPPSKTIGFYPKINNNDGLLVGYVARSMSLSRFDALKIIEKECEDIICRLDQGERVVMEGTGEFFLNENNEIGFQPHFNANMFPGSFGLEPVNFLEDIEDNGHTAAPAATHAGAPDTNEELNEEPGAPPENEPAATPVPEENGRKRKLWYLLLIIPLAAAGVYMLNNSQKNDKRPETPQVVADTTHTADSVPPPAADTVEITPPELAINPPAVTVSARFYVVAGSFQDENNAEKYIEQLALEGYTPFYIGKTGSFHIVGIGKYETAREAYKARRAYVKETHNCGAWIYEEKAGNEQLTIDN